MPNLKKLYNRVGVLVICWFEARAIKKHFWGLKNSLFSKVKTQPITVQQNLSTCMLLVSCRLPWKEVFWSSCGVDTAGLPTTGVTCWYHWYCWVCGVTMETAECCEDGAWACSTVPEGTLAGIWTNGCWTAVCPAKVNWGWKQQHRHNTLLTT